MIVGVRADGTKELVAIADGYRESTGSWEDLLRDAKRRGMRAPVVMVGDGALGMWSALGGVFPETRHQRCWVHKAAENLLALVPKAHQKMVSAAFRSIFALADPDDVRARYDEVTDTLTARFPKAAESLRDARHDVLAFTAFPRDHWRNACSIWSNNPIPVFQSETPGVSRRRLLGSVTVPGSDSNPMLTPAILRGVFRSNCRPRRGHRDLVLT